VCPLAQRFRIRPPGSTIPSGSRLSIRADPVSREEATFVNVHLRAGVPSGASGRALIVLDNFEQVVEQAQAPLGHWLERARDTTFVVTSRVRLELPGEEVQPLDPLTVEGEGVELFASGDAILFAATTLHADSDAEHADIHAERRIHLQVELAPPFERADSLRVLDGDGKGVLLRVMRGSTSETNPVALIEAGRSQVLSLSERARTVVLFARGVEVARLALRPTAEGVNLVRW